MNISNDAEPIAHIAEDGRRHALKEHLLETARMSSRFAGQFGAGEWGRIATQIKHWRMSVASNYNSKADVNRERILTCL